MTLYICRNETLLPKQAWDGMFCSHHFFQTRSHQHYKYLWDSVMGKQGKQPTINTFSFCF